MAGVIESRLRVSSSLDPDSQKGLVSLQCVFHSIIVIKYNLGGLPSPRYGTVYYIDFCWPSAIYPADAVVRMPETNQLRCN